MTRARCYALALLVGVCCLGPSRAFAQYVPVPQPGSSPGSPAAPFETPEPMTTSPWYGTGDDVEPSLNMFGPQVIVNSWFLRAEYLLWNIGSPGNVLLGAPVQGVLDPSQKFAMFAPQTSAEIGFGFVPTTNPIRLTDVSGVQVTTGVELVDGGRIELSAFMLGRKQSGYSLILGQPLDVNLLPNGTGIPGGALVPSVVATSTLSNGQVANHLFLYNTSYSAVMVSQLWGGEANYLAEYDTSEMLQFLPLMGLRYLNLSERLTQNGVFTDQVIPSPPINTTIESQTINNLWGGQIGFRSQIMTKYIEIGATPKLLFLGDSLVASVYAARFRSNSDPTVYTNDVTTKFTWGADVNAFVNINLTPNFTVRAGYTVLWINKVTRPQRNIVYDDHGLSAPAAITEQTVLHDIFINGLNFGCEFRF